MEPFRNEILPALQGLATDRVGGGGGGQDLAGLAEASGGYFTPAGAEPAAACARALAYMLVVEIDLSPEKGALERGEDHALTALIFRGGDPEAFPVAGVSLSDTVGVTRANAAPLCDTGGPYFLEVTADTMSLTLDAGASSDAEGDSLRFAWSVDADGAALDDATTMQPVLTLTGAALCADTLTVQLTVGDGWDESTCETRIVLQDLRPALVELVEPALQLWPVNGKHVRVSPEQVVASITNACGRELDLGELVILEVGSDEPENHVGDGNTLDDIVIECPGDVLLRAERMGGETGRAYSIVYGFVGDDGGMQNFTAHVEVPHDQSGDPVVPAVGMGYTVTADCPATD